MKIIIGILFMYLAGFSADNNGSYSAWFFAIAVYFFVSDYLERN